MDASFVIALLWMAAVAMFAAMAAVARSDRAREDDLIEEHHAWRASSAQRIAELMERTRSARRYMSESSGQKPAS